MTLARDGASAVARQRKDRAARGATAAPCSAPYLTAGPGGVQNSPAQLRHSRAALLSAQAVKDNRGGGAHREMIIVARAAQRRQRKVGALRDSRRETKAGAE